MSGVCEVHRFLTSKLHLLHLAPRPALYDALTVALLIGGNMSRGRTMMAAALLFAFLFADVAWAQEDEAERERNERVADVLAALGVRDGAKVADLGSADGFYTLRMARAVAPTGRAYAVDIDQKMLDRLRERAQSDGISNVDIILGDATDPKLPAGELDAVLIRNAYHEMPEYRSILAGVTKRLKQGGLLIVIEAIHENNRGLSREPTSQGARDRARDCRSGASRSRIRDPRAAGRVHAVHAASTRRVLDAPSPTALKPFRVARLRRSPGVSCSARG